MPRSTRLHGFEITDVLGEGGFSIVYAARDLQLGREVAIKEYVPGALASRRRDATVELRSARHKDDFLAGLNAFTNEARLLAQFRHPALVEILEFWEQNETAYMVMPRYSGMALRAVLRRLDFTYEESWLKGLVAPILDVLEMLHSRNVYHRDVAPDNILVKDDGGLVLLDLGSARELLQDDAQAPATVMVKSGYTPVEQYAGDGKLRQGPWTDIYALGALLYFAVAGDAPPPSISRLMRDSLKPLAETAGGRYSTAFCAGIDRALAVQPEDRPQSIAELRSLLDITSGARSEVPLDRLGAATAPGGKRRKERDEKTRLIPVADLQGLAARVAGSEAESKPVPQPASPPVTESGKPTAGKMKDSPARTPREKSPERARKTPAVTPAAAPAPRKASAPVSRRPAAPLAQRRRILAVAGIAAAVVAAGGGWLLWQASAQGRALRAAANGFVLDNLQEDRTRTWTDLQAAADRLASDIRRAPAPAVSADDFLPAQLLPLALAAVEIDADTAVAPPPRRAVVPEPEPAPEPARVGISVKPWAEVWIDGVRAGVSPPLVSMELAPGAHRVELRNPGQPAQFRELHLEAGGSAEIGHDFTVAPADGAEPQT